MWCISPPYGVICVTSDSDERNLSHFLSLGQALVNIPLQTTLSGVRPQEPYWPLVLNFVELNAC